MPDKEPHQFVDKDIEVDFRTRMTEPEWARTYESFALKLTPHFFNWIGWVFALGALQYTTTVSDSIALKIVWIIANVLLYFYFYAFFVRFKFTGFPFVGRDTWPALIVSGIISLSLAFVFNKAAVSIAKELADFQQRTTSLEDVSE